MSDKKNILIYEPYPFAKISGNLRTLIYIISFLDRDKFNIIIAVPFKTDLLNVLKNFDIEVIVLDTPKNLKLFGGKNLNAAFLKKIYTIFSIFSHSLDLIKLIKKNKIHLIYCNGIKAVSLMGLSSVITRRPILWYVKGKLENRILDTLAYFVSSRVVFYSILNSKDKYPLLQYLFKNKISIIPTGLDLDEIKIIKNQTNDVICKELDINARNLNIGFFGQLYEPKGVHFLIEAVGQVAKEISNIRLFIVGDSIISEYEEYSLKLNSIISTNNIEKNVFFTGWRNDALKIMDSMDIIIHPSLAEGFSRTVLEAMALGKAVIASGVGGERETIINGENGFLIKGPNIKEISKKILLLYKNPILLSKIGKNASKTVADKHSIVDKISQLGVLIENQINKNK